MKRLLYVALLVTSAAPAYATDVSIRIGQPGFYGRLDIGGYPPPPTIYVAPRVLYRSAESRPPVYLRVPPGHARHWRRHCGEYNACGERVYFVQDNWYEREYVPQYRQRHGEGRNGADGRRDDRHDRDRNDRNDDRGGRGSNGHHGS